MSVYTDNDYKNRDDYLESLSTEYEVDLSIVFALADILGEVEDFDGLVCALEDEMYTNIYI